MLFKWILFQSRCQSGRDGPAEGAMFCGAGRQCLDHDPVLQDLQLQTGSQRTKRALPHPVYEKFQNLNILFDIFKSGKNGDQRVRIKTLLLMSLMVG